MSSSTSVEESVRRIVLVAERRLVGQAIAAALRGRGLAPVLFDWPERGGRLSFRHGLARSGASVGVVLCDLRTPDLLHDVEVLVGRGPIRWLVLTDSDFGPRWGTVLGAGAAGVLPTTTTTDALAQAIRDTIAGGSPTPEVLRARALREWESVAEEQRDLVRRMERLTHREYEVLGSLYDGTSVRRIAEASGVAEATVRSQVKSLRRKLGVDSQLAAVAMYRRSLEVFPQARQ
ncbi:response regulator transcription factor [Nocardioides albidus]|uniref:Response regulator transcription factor n=1 Tax=Nocardioides albidus TaxID=1517589 RepID=A0A5C4VLD0_9ACTN|nr:response regulator transcription factor [Nocardioides albidus]TNM36356.1 response regulator transcription factor [Nocardioides albidus]